jgi:hypothetical protein
MDCLGLFDGRGRGDDEEELEALLGGLGDTNVTPLLFARLEQICFVTLG